jgi:GNAT superfamily N-acetyltransferase
MPNNCTIRHAAPSEAAELSRLATRSKAYWGYSQDFMNLCRDELNVTPAELAADGIDFVVAEVSGEIAGFYSLKQLSADNFDLQALYVDSGYIGNGFGGLLLDHALAAVQEQGGERLQIQSDPNATGFYVASGARQFGTQESGSIPGRFLPLLVIDGFNSDAAPV